MTKTTKADDSAATAAALRIVLGYDEQNKPRAAQFSAADAKLVAKAAELMDLKVYEASTVELAALAKKLPTGRLYANGKAFVPNVRQSLYSELVATLAAEPGAAVSKDQELPVATGLPPQFNSGFLVGASKIIVDDNKKIVTLRRASVNNGAQSQGEIKRYMDECAERGEEPTDFSIRCELSIEPDASTRTTIAVARNTATKIEGISIAGKHGYFEDLAKSFKEDHPDLELARSETDVEDKYVDTRLLLQVLWAMMPEELTPENRRSVEARMRAYKNAAYCLQDFIEIFDSRATDPNNAARYRYFVDMAGPAWSEYQRWHAHEQWNDKRLREPLRQVVRGDDGIIKVSDGIVFPILSALSRFVKKYQLKEGTLKRLPVRTWKIVYPKVFHDEDMLIAARRQLIQCGGRPMLMGRSGAAYEALMTLTEMAERYSAKAAAS